MIRKYTARCQEEGASWSAVESLSLTKATASRLCSTRLKSWAAVSVYREGAYRGLSLGRLPYQAFKAEQKDC